MLPTHLTGFWTGSRKTWPCGEPRDALLISRLSYSRRALPVFVSSVGVPSLSSSSLKSPVSFCCTPYKFRYGTHPDALEGLEIPALLWLGPVWGLGFSLIFLDCSCCTELFSPSNKDRPQALRENEKHDARAMQVGNKCCIVSS